LQTRLASDTEIDTAVGGIAGNDTRPVGAYTVGQGVAPAVESKIIDLNSGTVTAVAMVTKQGLYVAGEVDAAGLTLQPPDEKQDPEGNAAKARPSNETTHRVRLHESAARCTKGLTSPSASHKSLFVTGGKAFQAVVSAARVAFAKLRASHAPLEESDDCRRKPRAIRTSAGS